MKTSELVDVWISAWSGNDPVKLRSIFAEEFEYRDMPTNSRFTDVDGLKKFLTETYTVSPDFRIEVTSRLESENVAVVEWDMKSTYKGKPVSSPGCSVMAIRDGKLVSNHDYWDQVDYLVQCGLMERPEVFSGETGLSSSK